ncbi:hypothetical protein MAR_032439 [Mya arenaria]|uniref:Odorant receptor n=1 Tax=Mya arenaria TaxID=6604 RepID=A0ABY7F7B7_MYAAR|nr:hypothetical protein MAR_032439 [Mya arenaria]
MEIRIPKDKIKYILQQIEFTLSMSNIPLHQSFTSSLSFWTHAMPSASAFVRRMYSAMSHATRPHHTFRVTKGIQKEIEMRRLFLNQYNGVSVMLENEWLTNSDLQLFTDSACNSQFGCGVYFEGALSFLQLPEILVNSVILSDIAFLEMVPIALACYLWKDKFCSLKICLNCYNMAVVNTKSFKTERCPLSAQSSCGLCNIGFILRLFMFLDSVGNISSVGPGCGYQANAILLISLSPKTQSKFIALNAFMHGISFFLKLNNLPHFTRAFIIQKMLCGLRRNRPVKDTKMPLTIDIFKQILRALPFVASSTYETSIFNAAFVIAFFCFSIIGEIADVGKADPYTKVAQISDVSLSECKCTLLIRYSKTDQYGSSASLIFTQSSDTVILCLSVRSNIDGPLFGLLSREMLKNYQFRAITNIKSHSFGIGATTLESMLKIPDEDIKLTGR